MQPLTGHIDAVSSVAFSPDGKRIVTGGYKRRAKTGETLVSQGIVTRSNTRLALRRARHTMIKAAKASPLAPGLRQVARRLRGTVLSALTT